jgi:solute carrier family 25 protein 38
MAIGVLLNPFTMIKTRFESRAYGGRPEYHSVMMAAKDVVRLNGLRGLWSGWGAVILRDAPYSSLFLSLYGSLKREIRPRVSNETIAHSISALTAGAIACTVTQPFDMVRARMQLEPTHYKNTLHSLKRIISEEGFRALTTGFVPRLARKSVSSMVAWTLFDKLNRPSRKD